MNITLEKIPQPKGRKLQQYLVKRGAETLGLVEKMGPYPGEVHPWKAFAAGVEKTTGQQCAGAHYLGATYTDKHQAALMVRNHKDNTEATKLQDALKFL